MSTQPTILFYGGQSYLVKHLSGFVKGYHNTPQVRNTNNLNALAELGSEELETQVSNIYNALINALGSTKDVTVKSTISKVQQTFGPNNAYFWNHEWAYDPNELSNIWINEVFYIPSKLVEPLRQFMPSLHKSELKLNKMLNLSDWTDKAREIFTADQLRVHILSNRVTIQYNDNLYWEVSPNSLTLMSSASGDQLAHGGGSSYEEMQKAWKHINTLLP